MICDEGPYVACGMLDGAKKKARIAEVLVFVCGTSGSNLPFG